MRRSLLTLLLLTLLLTPLGRGQSLPMFTQLDAGQSATSLSAAAATGAGIIYGTPYHQGQGPSSDFTWFTYFTGTPTAITVTLEGSVDGKLSATGTAQASSTTFRCTGCGFAAMDVGKIIYISNGATGGGTFQTTISTVTNATTVVLAGAPTATAVGTVFWWGRFAVLDTSVSTTSEMRHKFGAPVKWLRCNITAYTVNASTTGCDIYPK